MNAIASFFPVTFRVLLIMTLLLGGGSVLYAQSDGADGEEDEKADVSIELRYKEANNRAKFLLAIAKSKVDEFYQPVSGLEIRFYRKELAPENFIGTGTTNAKGTAYCELKSDEAGFFAPSFDYVYLAAVEDNEEYNDAEEEITVAESAFDMELDVEDSVGQITITFTGMDENGEMVPVEYADVGIYVQRMFGLLPVTEDMEMTDESGSVTIEFPRDIPGDSAGNVILVAKIDEHERYGYLEARRKVNWGVPAIDTDSKANSRELWSSRANAPLYLIFVVNAVLIGIWAVLLYIIYELFQIKKIGSREIKPSE